MQINRKLITNNGEPELDAIASVCVAMVVLAAICLALLRAVEAPSRVSAPTLVEISGEPPSVEETGKLNPIFKQCLQNSIHKARLYLSPTRWRKGSLPSWAASGRRTPSRASPSGAAAAAVPTRKPMAAEAEAGSAASERRQSGEPTLKEESTMVKLSFLAVGEGDIEVPLIGHRVAV